MDKLVLEDLTPQALETIIAAYRREFSITAPLPDAKRISDEVRYSHGHSCELTPDPFGHPDDKLVFELYSQGIGVRIVPNSTIESTRATVAFYNRLEKDLHHAQDIYRRTKGLYERTKEALRRMKGQS